jgi:hypothetical protein
VKVHPSNQTLILANERPNSDTKSSQMLDEAWGAAASGSSLQRITIVAARPDTSFLYLRADYASQSNATTPGASASEPAEGIDDGPASAAPSSSRGALVSLPVPARYASIGAAAQRDAYGNSPTMNPAVEQYARTQRILTQASAYVDVYA